MPQTLKLGPSCASASDFQLAWYETIKARCAAIATGSLSSSMPRAKRPTKSLSSWNGTWWSMHGYVHVQRSVSLWMSVYRASLYHALHVVCPCSFARYIHWLVPFGAVWCRLVPFGAVWCSMCQPWFFGGRAGGRQGASLRSTVWCHLVPFGVARVSHGSPRQHSNHRAPAA